MFVYYKLPSFFFSSFSPNLFIEYARVESHNPY